MDINTKSKLKDWAVGLLMSSGIVYALVVIGNHQAGQYQKVVEEIRANGRATVCILAINPDARDQVNISQCLRRAGARFDAP